MIRPAFLLPILLLSLGCQKTADNKKSDDEPKPNIVGNGSGNLSVGGGGGGGAAQAVRKAAARTVNLAEIGDLRLTIVNAMTEDPNQNPPSAQQIKEAARQNGKLAGLIKDEVIILTDSQKKDGIWAYTKWPQKADKHYAITATGVE